MIVFYLSLYMFWVCTCLALPLEWKEPKTLFECMKVCWVCKFLLLLLIFFVLTNMVIFFKWPNKFYLLKNIFIAYHNFKQPNNNNSNTTLNIRCTLFLCYYDAYMYIYAQKQQHILHYKCYPYLIYLWFFLQYF